MTHILKTLCKAWCGCQLIQCQSGSSFSAGWHSFHPLHRWQAHELLKSPFQTFVEELCKNWKLQDKWTQLQGDVHRLQDSETLKCAMRCTNVHTLVCILGMLVCLTSANKDNPPLRVVWVKVSDLGQTNNPNTTPIKGLQKCASGSEGNRLWGRGCFYTKGMMQMQTEGTPNIQEW